MSGRGVSVIEEMIDYACNDYGDKGVSGALLHHFSANDMHKSGQTPKLLLGLW